MAKHIWCSGAENTHNFTWWNGETQCWNGVTIKIVISLWQNGVKNIMKWRIEYTQDRMVKWRNKPAEIPSLKNLKCWNGYTHLHQPSISHPLRRWVPILLLDSIRFWIFRICISSLWEVPRWLSNRPTSYSNSLWWRTPPAAFDRYIYSAPSFRHHQHWRGSSPFLASSFSPLFAVTIPEIYYIISVIL